MVFDTFRNDTGYVDNVRKLMYEQEAPKMYQPLTTLIFKSCPDDIFVHVLSCDNYSLATFAIPFDYYFALAHAARAATVLVLALAHPVGALVVIGWPLRLSAHH